MEDELQYPSLLEGLLLLGPAEFWSFALYGVAFFIFIWRRAITRTRIDSLDAVIVGCATILLLCFAMANGSILFLMAHAFGLDHDSRLVWRAQFIEKVLLIYVFSILAILLSTLIPQKQK